MSYVIYNKESTLIHRILRNGYWQEAKYETETAAKAGLTREAKKGKLKLEDVAIAEYSHFSANIEKWETKRNLIGGGEFRQRVNTPLCCDPSSETYHSM